MAQQASGYLDGALQLQVGNNIESALEGSNLLNTTAVNRQQLAGNSILMPGAAPVWRDSAWIRTIGGSSWECGSSIEHSVRGSAVWSVPGCCHWCSRDSPCIGGWTLWVRLPSAHQVRQDSMNPVRGDLGGRKARVQASACWKGFFSRDPFA